MKIWLEQKVYEDEVNHLPKLKIHSDNPVGRQNMELAIRSIQRYWARKNQ